LVGLPSFRYFLKQGEHGGHRRLPPPHRREVGAAVPLAPASGGGATARAVGAGTPTAPRRTLSLPS